MNTGEINIEMIFWKEVLVEEEINCKLSSPWSVSNVIKIRIFGATTKTILLFL